MAKTLYTVFYADDSSCENDFINVVAEDDLEAKKSAIQEYRSEHGLEEGDTIDIEIIDAFPVTECFDGQGNKYQVILKKI